MCNSLKLRRMWLVLGYLWVITVVTMSLLPNPPDTRAIFQGDKVIHGATYLFLMVWFCQLYDPNNYKRVGWYLFLLGVMVEFAQRVTGYRFFELADILANSLGILVGWLLVKLWFANLFKILERALMVRTIF